MENYKGNLSASGTIIGSLIAQAGPQGKTGKEGYTPIKGVDYYTEAEKQEIVQSITQEVEGKLEPSEEVRQLNEQERIANENTRVEKEIERQTAETNRVSNEELRQQNETVRETQESEREESENRRIDTFSQMQKDVESAINNIEDMTDAYNRNATEKTNDFNNNVTSKSEIFDANAADKTTAFNENAQFKIDEFNANAAVLENRVSSLETDNTNNKQNILNIQEEQNLQNDKLNILENKNTEQDEEIANIKTEQENQNNRLNGIEENNTTQDETIQELQNNVTNLESDNTTNKADISNIKAEQETQNNKLTAIEEKDISQDDLIEELQNQVVELESENENLKNQIPIGETEGENITLNDSAGDIEFKELRIGGNSWQETRSGKNLFDKSSTEITSNNAEETQIDTGKRITLTGTTYSYSVFKINQNISKYAGKTVRLNANFSKSNSNLNPKYGVLLADSNYSTGRELKGESKISGYTITFDLPSTFENGKEYLFIRVYGTEDKEGDVGDYVDFTDVILTIDNTDISYEPYGTMPSPEFRSEIRNVTGSANITVCNKNLTNYKDWTKINSKGTLEITEDTLTYNAVNGAYGVYTPKIKLKPNTPYTAYTDYSFTGTMSTSWGFRVKLNETFGSIAKSNIINFITDETGLMQLNFYIAMPYTGEDATLVLKNLRLYEGTYTKDTIPEYVKPESQQFTFPLSEGQRMYKDSYLADDGVHHKRGRYVFTGNETVSLYAGGTYGFVVYINGISIKHIATVNSVFCNKLKRETLGNLYDYRNTKGLNIISSYATGLAVMINDLTTTEEIKAYLAEQYANGTPVIAEYELAEEVIEPYTEEQQLVYNEMKKAHSYKNVTHIFSTDETSPVFEVTYRKDLETMFNNINTAIVSLGGV